MSLATGTRLGHYQVVSSIGAGGMGEIYLAEDARLGRKVALKLLPQQFTQNVDSDIPILIEAKKEYEQLKQEASSK